MNASAGRQLTKEYDFRVMSDLSEFTDRYIWPRNQIINNESQFYTELDKYPQATLTRSGLSITAIKTPDDLIEYAQGQPYLSALLTTRDNGPSQLHGYWEMSAKLPAAKGAWPAFWLLPTTEKWPPGVPILSEIDIMEGINSIASGIYHGTLHTNDSGVSVASTNNEIETGADLINEYHRYGLSWEPDYITWYFDDREVIRRKTPNDMQAEPRHFLINLAVGGWADQPDPDDYPASFEIEWVRIYESNYVAPPPPRLGDYPGDVVHVLADGRAVTRPQIEAVAQMLLEINLAARHKK